MHVSDRLHIYLLELLAMMVNAVELVSIARVLPAEEAAPLLHCAVWNSAIRQATACQLSFFLHGSVRVGQVSNTLLDINAFSQIFSLAP